MNKLNYLLCLLLIVSTSCTLTNEQRAEKLVSQCVKDYLAYPDSYEAISTTIDSTRFVVSTVEPLLEIVKEVSSLSSKIEYAEIDLQSAQSTMEIFAPDGFYYSDYERGKYNRAKEEVAKHKADIQNYKEKLQNKILSLKQTASNLYSDEVCGWVVTHRYRSKGDNGEQLAPQEMVFFCDLELEHCNGWNAKYFEIISKIIVYINDSESDEELLDNLRGFLYIL